MRRLLLIILNFALAAMFTSNAWAQVLKQDHVEVRLIAPANQDEPGLLKIGVHFKIDPEWHIYWKNPGDSGAAPKFELSGGDIAKVHWPFPVRLPVEHLTNYGYEHEVVFPLDIKPSTNELTLNLEWLVCKVECLPGFGKFNFSKSKMNITIDDFNYHLHRAKVPSSSPDWSAQFKKKEGDFVQFEVTPHKLAIGEIKSLFVYPENGEMFKTNLPTVEPGEKNLRVTIPLSSNAKASTTEAAFTFVVHQTNGGITSFTQVLPTSDKPVPWPMGLLLAFLGGVILNLMPCVFPVLFLKAFGFLKEPESAKIRRSSWAYSLGVVLAFFSFGALLTALRFSGEAIGWGYQLQNPVVVFGLALLFFAMALNFYGFFEIGDALSGKAGDLGNRKFLSGSFGTGVLAVVVASPCTAPFMGTALGLTLLLPAYQSLLIFVALGVGMAAPMLLLAYVPALVRRLPRSGPWMVTLKQFLSFPLFATCVWLLWVLANQKGSDAVFVSLASFLAVTFGIWILKTAHRRALKIFAVLIIIGAIASAGVLIAKTVATDSKTSSSNWAPYDENVINEKRKAGPVFIDFTASWCITCQVNKKAVLETDEIQTLFKSRGVYLVRADWTNRDPKITAALAAFKRNSVPFYVFYKKNQEAQTLPELLTKDLVRDIIEGATK